MLALIEKYSLSFQDFYYICKFLASFPSCSKSGVQDPEATYGIVPAPNVNICRVNRFEMPFCIDKRSSSCSLIKRSCVVFVLRFLFVTQHDCCFKLTSILDTRIRNHLEIEGQARPATALVVHFSHACEVSYHASRCIKLAPFSSRTRGYRRCHQCSSHLISACVDVDVVVW